MEKLFGFIFYICMICLTYQMDLTGYRGPIINYVAVAITCTILLGLGLYVLYQIPKVAMIAMLKITKTFLKAVHSSLKKSVQANSYRLNVIQRLRRKYDVVYWLYRQNSRLTQEIESLKSEVHSLNQDIKLVVKTWTPNGAVDVAASAPRTKPAANLVENALSPQLDFIEKEQQTSSSTEAASL